MATHAGKIDGFVERFLTARDAANQVTMNNEAFGVICQPFALLLQPFEENGVSALEQGSDALTDTARKVRDTATSYTGTDTGEAADFRGIEGEM